MRLGNDGRPHGRRSASLSAAARVAAVDKQRAARLLSYDLVSLISDYQVETALPIASQARDLVEDAVEPFEVAFRVAHVLITAGRTADGADLTARVMAAAEQMGNLTAAVNIAQPCTWLERYSDAQRLLDTSTAALRSVDALWMLGHALVARAPTWTAAWEISPPRILRRPRRWLWPNNWPSRCSKQRLSFKLPRWKPNSVGRSNASRTCSAPSASRPRGNAVRASYARCTRRSEPVGSCSA
jgi:hypothetical protein